MDIKYTNKFNAYLCLNVCIVLIVLFSARCASKKPDSTNVNEEESKSEKEKKITELKTKCATNKKTIEENIKKIGDCPSDTINLKDYVIDKNFKSGSCLDDVDEIASIVWFGNGINEADSIGGKLGLKIRISGTPPSGEAMEGFKTHFLSKVTKDSAIYSLIESNLKDLYQYSEYNAGVSYAECNNKARNDLAIIIGTLNYLAKHHNEVYLKAKDDSMAKNKEALKYIDDLKDSLERYRCVRSSGGTENTDPDVGGDFIRWTTYGTAPFSVADYKTKAKAAIEEIIKCKEDITKMEGEIKDLEEEVKTL